VEELTRDEVWDALEQGRVFVAFDWLADAKGFHSQVVDRSKGEAYPLGSQVVWRKELSWTAESPLESHWRLVRNGTCIAEKEGFKFEELLAEPGVYRIEAWLMVGEEKLPWVLSNPIYVNGGDDGP
jgi:hypothetical protein